jgi:type I restriction enzyme S subunit
LSEVVDFWDGKRVPLKEEERATIPGPIPYYGASGIIDWIDRWLFDDELILLGEDGENILSRNLPLAFRVSGKCWVNNHAHVLKPKSDQNIDFWTEALEWRDYAHMISGSAQPKITQGQLARMLVARPDTSEQGRLASALKAVTHRLDLEREERDKLRRLKQGLMDDLLRGRVAVPVGAARLGGAANV